MTPVSSALKTKLCDLLGVRYPIIQTGMGWVATPELVAAVSNAGGFGFLAAATLAPEAVAAEIEKTRRLTEPSRAAWQRRATTARPAAR
jgi:nitronate monooxygenase